MSRCWLIRKTRIETERDLVEYRKAAANYNIVVDPFQIAEFDEVEEAFAKLKQSGCDGVVLSVAAIFGIMRKEIADAALSARIPLIGNNPLYVPDGALLAYGPLIRDCFAIAAKYVKRVLGGERALPVEQPTKFEMAVNLKTAKAIGIELPTSIPLRADPAACR